MTGPTTPPAPANWYADPLGRHELRYFDGTNWTERLSYPRASDSDDVRADVYFELPSGELVLQLWNAQGFGPNGRGYQLLSVQ